MSKSLARVAVLVGAIQSGFVSALGVGDIALASSLNQPFKAFIPLREAEGLEAAQLRVDLADASAFDNAGIDRTQFLNSLDFIVEVGENGRGRIIVTTTQPVVEPYLDFIIEVRWPNGRMLREYTVLLDLPVFESDLAPTQAARVPVSNVSPSPAQPSSPVAEREPGGSRGSVSVAPPVPVSSVQDDSAKSLQPRPLEKKTDLPSSDQDGQYRVQHHDTMWQVAAKLRPSAFVTTEQTMIALLRKNPEAFIGNNINRVKSGYVLEIPSEDEINALDHETALQTIRQQAKDWRQRRTSSAVSVDAGAASEQKAPQLDATKKAEQAPVDSAASDDVRFSIGSAGDTASSEEVDELRRRLSEEQEVLEQVQLENASMASRVREMEKQVDTLQKLIALKNRELAALQAGLAANSADATEEANAISAEIAEVEASLEEDQRALEEREAEITAAARNALNATAPNANEEGGDAEPAADAADVASEAAESVPPMSTEQERSPAPAETPWYLVPLYQYAAAGLGVLLLLLLLMRRRAGANDDAEPQIEPPLADAGALNNLDAPSADELAPVDELDEPSAEADAAAEEIAGDFDFDSLNDEFSEQPSSESAEESVEESVEEAVQPQTGDAISEAEIYVAYGRYDQAASLLKSAIANEPENTELRVKLLDIYLDTRDREAFLEAYQQLEMHGDADALARVKESMSAIEGVSGWLSDEPSSAVAEELESLDNLDEELAFLDGEDQHEDDGSEALDEEVEATPMPEADPNLAAGAEELSLDDDSSTDSETAADEPVLEGLEDFDFASDDSLDADGRDDELELDALSTEGSDLELDDGSFEALDELGDADLDLSELSVGDDAVAESDTVAEGNDLGADLSDFDFSLEDSDLGESMLSTDDSEPQPEAAAEELSELDDLDAALADLDAEVEGLSLAEDAGADTEDQAIETVVDAADADADQEPLTSTDGVALDEAQGDADEVGALNLDDLVFDEFSADSAEEDMPELSDSDDIANKLDLARAFIDMGDEDGARDIINEVLEAGSDEQKAAAQALMEQLK
ncbi:FimV/HubP family polar landmark protein [uncultured Spongiibacter sp.]|uniref:FimV/HubP family polar landmark protein n=1 Tax=uncultured Spongiibacter sp. TaxID=870896 RepID=UPI002586035F|nr:FimV/HubP family polar landmark protein [uncultured Spongiibacter sp.]